MTPLRRGKGRRQEPPESSRKARDEAAEKGAADGAGAVSEEVADEAGKEPAKRPAAGGRVDERARARDAASAERQAQKDAARADRDARKRAAREAKAKRRAARKRSRAERRARKERDRSEAAEKRKAEAEKRKAEAEKPQGTKRKADEKKPAIAKPKAKAEARPEAGKPKRPARKRPQRVRERAERPKTEKPKAAGKPRRERAGAGVALKRAGTRVNSVVTGPRARRAAGRVDSGIQSAWKLLLAGLAALLAGALIIGRFVWAGLRELAALWIRAAEVLGEAILWTYRRLRPIVVAALRALRRALAWAERAVTPKRAVALVVIVSAAVLAASQFVDYRGVRIGAPEYADVEAVAPAPQTDRQTTGSVHGYAMVPVAVVVIAAALLALRGRWRMARIIPVLAALAIAVTLLLDARKGLDEGDAAIAYQGAQAVLIEGFWLQLASAAVLVVTGLLLARYARLSGAPARRPRPSGDGRASSDEGGEQSDDGAGQSPRRKRRFGIAGVRA